MDAVTLFGPLAVWGMENFGVLRENPGKRAGGPCQTKGGISPSTRKTLTNYNFTEFFLARPVAIVVCEGFQPILANFWRTVVCEGFQWAEKKLLMKYWEEFSDFWRALSFERVFSGRCNAFWPSGCLGNGKFWGAGGKSGETGGWALPN